jgi:hypothetical protein
LLAGVVLLSVSCRQNRERHESNEPQEPVLEIFSQFYSIRLSPSEKGYKPLTIFFKDNEYAEKTYVRYIAEEDKYMDEIPVQYSHCVMTFELIDGTDKVINRTFIHNGGTRKSHTSRAIIKSESDENKNQSLSILPVERFNFRHIIALNVLYGGCLVLMLIGGILLRSLCLLQKNQSVKPAVLQRIIAIGMGIFTFGLPLFFSDELSPIPLTTIEAILIGFGYLLSAAAFIYLSMPETKMRSE